MDNSDARCGKKKSSCQKKEAYPMAREFKKMVLPRRKGK